MSFFAPYRRLFEVPGARTFWPAALLGRLPLSMVGLGLVLLVPLWSSAAGRARHLPDFEDLLGMQ